MWFVDDLDRREREALKALSEDRGMAAYTSAEFQEVRRAARVLECRSRVPAEVDSAMGRRRRPSP